MAHEDDGLGAVVERVADGRQRAHDANVEGGGGGKGAVWACRFLERRVCTVNKGRGCVPLVVADLAGGLVKRHVKVDTALARDAGRSVSVGRQSSGGKGKSAEARTFCGLLARLSKRPSFARGASWLSRRRRREKAGRAGRSASGGCRGRGRRAGRRSWRKGDVERNVPHQHALAGQLHSVETEFTHGGLLRRGRETGAGAGVTRRAEGEKR